MATNPTRHQNQARDLLADALGLVVRAFHLDGRSRLGPADRETLTRSIAAVSSVHKLDDLLARAIETRALALGMSAGLAEMLTLVDSEVRPLDLIWADDERFKERVARIEAELGDV